MPVDVSDDDKIDYVDLALSLGRDEFIARCDAPVLVGDDALAKPRGPQPTIAGKEFPEIQRFLAGGPPPVTPVQRTLVCPVRKTTKTFPSMITIGRTSNNDLVLNDVEVSKFHAFIRQTDAGFEILDAGSSNGTWVGDKRLGKREAHALRFGDTVRFGRLRFQFCDAAGCWEILRQRRRA